MRLLTSVFLLYLFLSIPTHANTSTAARYQSPLRFLSFDITATNLKQYRPNTTIAIQFNHFIYRTTLAEILACQLLSLAFVVNLFYLHTQQ